MQDKRIRWIDLARSIAIFSVVVCHSTEGIYSLRQGGIDTYGRLSEVIALGLFSFGRLGVPVFFMITGYLLLDRPYDTEKCKKFWGGVLHLWVCTIVWWIFYDFWLYCAGYDMSLLRVAEDLLFLRGVALGHSWYMPVILSLYILIPFVANALKPFDTKVIIFPTVVFTVYIFGFQFINILNNAFQRQPFSLGFYVSFSGGCYGLYLIYGYLLKRGVLKKLGRGYILGMIILSYLTVVFFQVWTYNSGFAYNVWYDFPFLLLCSAGVFELLSRVKMIYCYAVVRLISKYAFAIYLIHNLVRPFVTRAVDDTALMRAYKVAIVSVVTFGVSLLIAFVISKIPKVGKYLLLKLRT